ncbi:FAD-binding protein [Streptomonospora sp. S1-112]|uniref:FAD-binding protein n=1 Tax=Streptomonospora mangrovi TaxID=2883123 RepID=A0A9X3NMX2_9ACTN|nr:FAD-binding protein [Streptomonospora mangrovi]MDA0563465.1 FAD-binding protein [Streptomonospora mangrovi]
MVNDDGAGLRIGPDDWRYPTLRRGYNPRWTADPLYVRLVATPQEAVRALEAAVNEPPVGERSRVTVRSGGHCYEDFVSSPDVRAIIDVGLMHGIYWDPARQAVCVEAGASNGDIGEKLTKKLGFLLPGGSCATVGVGGHITGGGYGLFSRQHGLTVDYLDAVEVAVVRRRAADGRLAVDLVTASRADQGELGDLWWAHTGGGGGNFGMVTRFWFKNLPQAPSGALRLEAGWDWSAMDYASFKRLVDNFGAFFRDHQDDERYGPLFGILLLTPNTSRQIGLIAQIDATLPDARARLLEFVHALDSGVGAELGDRAEAHGEHPLLTGSKDPVHVDITDLTTMPLLSNDQAGKYKSCYMRTPLTEHHIHAAWQGLTRPPAEVRDAVVQIDSYGGAVNRIAPEATAVAQRDSVLKLQHQVYWPSGTDPEPRLKWIRELYRAMYGDSQGRPGVPVPDEVTDGCYISYPDVDLSDPAWNRSNVPWSTLYYKQHYARLRRVKRTWDPFNVFRHRQSVEP